MCDNVCIYHQVVDESKLVSYQTKLKKWEERQEEKKHLFTITQDNLSSTGSGSHLVTANKIGKVSCERLRLHF